ncbi:bone morphogenetic protein 5-like [Cotesia glomerata]|uniref:bone morphogenetic protein 5-like n=1 Tax=Cotesia glomerata TaxID=32391 RepID=UPI001D016876|nr:bone morphogenetic protein 5-like [Cotesia glomerata]
MDSLVVLSILVSSMIGDQGLNFKENPADLNNSAVRYMESILEEFNQDTRWGALDTAEMVISSMMPATNNLDNLRFDISKLDGTFESAELRIFQHAGSNCHPWALVRQNDCENCELIKSKTKEGQGKKGGWLVFNVTKVVQSWMEDPGRNQGFSISAGCDIELGVSGKLSPLMVCYSKRKPGPADIRSLVKITKRSVLLDTGLLSARLFNKPKIRMVIKNHRTVKKNLADYKNTSEVCGIKSFDLWLEDIGRNQIIAPKRINFKYCSGVCKQSKHDTRSYFKGYEHFLIFSALMRAYPEEVPAIFCLPTQFSGISVRYFKEGKVINRKVFNFNAEKCSCE